MLGKKIAALLIGKPFPEQVSVAVAPEVLARRAGVYRFDPQTTRTVTVEGDRLFSQRSGGAREGDVPAAPAGEMPEKRRK